MSLTLDPVRGVAEAMMRLYAPPPPKPPRRWATPGDLAVALDPATVQTPALELIDQELVQLADPTSGVNKLMVYMSPQEGKSVRVSHRFAEWLLVDNPDLRIAIVSYADEMARRWGSDIKLDAETFNGDEGTIDLGLKLRADSRAAGRWQIQGRKGGVYCVGIGGALTGKAVDCMGADTAILTELGYIRIDDIHAAGAPYPRVLSYNGDTGQPEWRRVLASRAIPDRPLVEIRTHAGRVIRCTPDHRVYVVGRGYVAAADLEPGARLLAADDRSDRMRGVPGRFHPGQVDALADDAGEPDHDLSDLPRRPPQVEDDTVSVVRHLHGERDTVYDLQVDGNRNFFADQVLVHNCLIIDDPLKNLEEAQSSKYRKRFQRFWQGVCIPRLGPNTICVIIQTRWHEEDAGGWLQKREPNRWRVVSIPAIAGKPKVVKGADGEDREIWLPDGVDPLGRAPGEAMVSARGDRDWAQIREDAGEYVWNALYQQRPHPAEGGLFKRAKLRRWHSMPADFTRHGVLGGQRVDLGGRVVYLDDCWRFITIDLAASTKTSADYTAVGVWAISNEGDLIMLDGNRDQIEQDDHWGLVRPLREKWAADTVFVESRMFGTTLVYEAGRNGIPVQELHADTDKFTRALPAAARAGAGRLWLPAGEGFVTDVVDELVAFPNATNDDYVDVVAYAARVVAAHWLPSESAAASGVGRRPVDEGAIGDAFEAATGQHSNGTDYFNLQY